MPPSPPGSPATAAPSRGPTGQPVQASIAFDGVTAVVEVANTCGLGLLPDGRLLPLDASSRGFGEAVLFALSLRPAGSCWRSAAARAPTEEWACSPPWASASCDASGRSLDGNGRNLGLVHSVLGTLLSGLAETELIVASDVHNPLCGPDGAPAVFGPQKGASLADVAALDAGLMHFVSVLASVGFEDAASVAEHPGAGSAGGIGFACLLLGASQVSGADYFLDLLDFDTRKDSCDSSSPARAASTSRPSPESCRPPSRAARVRGRSSPSPAVRCCRRSGGPRCRFLTSTPWRATRIWTRRRTLCCRRTCCGGSGGKLGRGSVA